MATDPGPGERRRLDHRDVGTVESALEALGWSAPTSPVAKLAGGASGSQVYLLQSGTEQVVLKVTEDPAWQDRAERELLVYRELASALEEFLPVVRASQHDRHGVRLLLTAHEPQPPAATLTDDAWVAVTHQLGRLHSAPVPRRSWLSRRADPAPHRVHEALRHWAGRGLGPLANRAARQLADTDWEAPMSPVLIHGDCHLHNLLRGPGGRPLWIDWQEVCLGSGPDDLAFLWQRAEFEGAVPPRESMLAAYAGARSLPVDTELRAALAATELRLLLVEWPAFLPYGSPQNQETMIRRLEQLVASGG